METQRKAQRREVVAEHSICRGAVQCVQEGDIDRDRRATQIIPTRDRMPMWLAQSLSSSHILYSKQPNQKVVCLQSHKISER